MLSCIPDGTRASTLGPLIALAIAVVIFSLTSSTFMNIDNMSLVLQQTIVIATLALLPLCKGVFMSVLWLSKKP